MSSARNPFESVWFLPIFLGAGTVVAVAAGGLAAGFDVLPLVPIAVVAGVMIGAVFLLMTVRRDRTMDRVAGGNSPDDSFRVTKQALRGDLPADHAERRRALEIAEFWQARQHRFGRILIPVWVVLTVLGLGLLVVDFSISLAVQVGSFGLVAVLWWLQERQLRRRVQELRSGGHDGGQ